jgi:hypothetical protein
MTTTLKSFTTTTRAISKEVVVEGDTWMATCAKEQTFQLFEVANPGVEDCRVLYRAKLRTEGLVGKAYLEMWCCFKGRGEFFSRGIYNMVTGTTDWASRETPFFLKKGEKPDAIRMNLVVRATGWLFWKKPVSGRIWIKDVELLQEPR